MVSESLMLPVPVALKPVAPPEAVAVQVSELMAGLRARGSVTDAPVAVDGPGVRGHDGVGDRRARHGRARWSR
jgi:hypothetical protein